MSLTNWIHKPKVRCNRITFWVWTYCSWCGASIVPLFLCRFPPGTLDFSNRPLVCSVCVRAAWPAHVVLSSFGFHTHKQCVSTPKTEEKRVRRAGRIHWLHNQMVLFICFSLICKNVQWHINVWRERTWLVVVWGRFQVTHTVMNPFRW